MICRRRIKPQTTLLLNALPPGAPRVDRRCGSYNRPYGALPLKEPKYLSQADDMQRSWLEHHGRKSMTGSKENSVFCFVRPGQPRYLQTAIVILFWRY